MQNLAVTFIILRTWARAVCAVLCLTDGLTLTHPRLLLHFTIGDKRNKKKKTPLKASAFCIAGIVSVIIKVTSLHTAGNRSHKPHRSLRWWGLKWMNAGFKFTFGSTFINIASFLKSKHVSLLVLWLKTCNKCAKIELSSPQAELTLALSYANVAPSLFYTRFDRTWKIKRRLGLRRESDTASLQSDYKRKGDLIKRRLRR